MGHGRTKKYSGQFKDKSMRKVILCLFLQINFINVAISQDDHIKEFARQTWMDYVDIRNRMDSVDREVRSYNNRINYLEKNNDDDKKLIQELTDQQNLLHKKLRKLQVEFLRKDTELKNALDSLKRLKVQTTDLENLADSLSNALVKEQLVVKQLSFEKSQLEKTLYFKIADLEIAEVENSYFSNFDVGYERKDHEIIYSENSKEQSTKPFLKQLRYLRFTGNVYVPPGVDTLKGMILVYKNDVLFEVIPDRFVVDTKTKNYNIFEMNGKDRSLNKKVPPKSDLKIAFVTDIVYSTETKKLQNFYDAYRSALFVITSVRPLASDLLNDNSINPVIVTNDALTITDTVFNVSGYVNVSIINSLDYFTNEYVSLSINDSIISPGFKLMPFDQKFTVQYDFKKGPNTIKVKALSGSIMKNLPDCYLWLYITTIGDGQELHRKKVILKKDNVFLVYILSP